MLLLSRRKWARSHIVLETAQLNMLGVRTQDMYQLIDHMFYDGRHLFQLGEQALRLREKCFGKNSGGHRCLATYGPSTARERQNLVGDRVECCCMEDLRVAKED